MQSVKVTASTQYDILIERGILKRAGELIKEYTGARRALLITDRTVDGLYSKAALDSLKSAGIECEKFVFENGEEHKSLKTVGDILSFAAGLNLTRSDIFIALGGGSGAQGTGGMATKLTAARIATSAGCDMVICDGSRPENLYDIADGKKVGTRFFAKR